MVLVLLVGQMEEFIKENGKMENSMEKEIIIILIKKNGKKDYGNMEKE